MAWLGRCRLALIVPFVAVLSSCADRPVVAPDEKPDAPIEGEPPAAPLAQGVYELTFTGIGTPNMAGVVSSSSSASVPSPAPPGLVFQQISASSFIEGTRTGGGHRYVNFVYRVRNGTGAPLTNLTLMAVSTASTIASTPFSSVLRFDNSAADPSLPPKIVPTGAVALGEDGWMRALYPDVMQAFTEAEVAAIAPPASVTGIFPFGYVVRNSQTGGRTLPPAVDANDYSGVVTLSMRVPLAASGALDVFTIVMQILAVQDSETRLTESIEESGDTAATRRLRARATQIGASIVTVLNGSPAVAPEVADYPGQRQICSLRTAGTAGAPVAHVTEPGPFVQLYVLRSNESLDPCAANFRTSAGEPARPATNVSFPVMVYAMDRYGNIRTAATDAVRLEQTGATGTMPAAANLVAGELPLNLMYTNYGTSVVTVSTRTAAGRQVIPVMGVTRTWTAGAGTTDWHTGANWAGGAAPMYEDSVYVPAVPSGGAFFPAIAQNVAVRGVTVENAATISLGAFDLTANANVSTGTTGGITATVGRLFLSGIAATVQGVLPRLRVTGTYSLTANVTTRAPLRVERGRLRNERFRVRATSE